MIHFLPSDTDIFDVKADAYVNPVNCYGIAGKGLALEFRKRFPDAYNHYKKCCQKRLLLPGGVIPFPIINKNLYIVCLATKFHWRESSQLNFIQRGVSNLKSNIALYGWKTIAIPALGCGLGGLNWQEVRQIIQDGLKDVPIDIYLIPPQI